MKKVTKITVLSILSILIMISSINVLARYLINEKETIRITASDSNVEVSVNSTTESLTSASDIATFNLTIKNNNPYPVTYSFSTSSTRLVITGEKNNNTLAANTEITEAITVQTKPKAYYSEDLCSANIVVDITEPYLHETKNIDLALDMTKYNHELSVLIMAHNTVKTTTPNFAENVTTTASSGLFSTEDESGTSLYFRGAITNNYVSFANKIWRIIRINGDGSYRLILDESIGKSAFSTISSTTYNNIGYMYANASTPKANTSSSEIKNYLDNWYTSNLANFDNYIDKDAIFWQDREIASTSGTIVTYKGWARIISNSPTLKPQEGTEDDWFSVTDTIGNGKLSQPIGLITSDELVMAGATMTGATLTGYGTHYANRAIYIYSNDLEDDAPVVGMWTMTPRRFITNNPPNSHHIVYKPHASIYSEPGYSTTIRRVKPVINLLETVTAQGKGTATDPYVIKSVN